MLCAASLKDARGAPRAVALSSKQCAQVQLSAPESGVDTQSFAILDFSRRYLPLHLEYPSQQIVRLGELWIISQGHLHLFLCIVKPIHPRQQNPIIKTRTGKIGWRATALS